MKPAIFERLESRLLSTVGVGLLVFSVIGGLFTYTQAYRSELGLAESLQQQLVRTVQIQAEVAAFAANTQIAQGVLSGLVGNPVILGARIESAEGFKVDLGYREKVDLGTSRTYALHSPIDRKEVIGTLTVVQNDDRVRSNAVEAAMFHTALMLLQVLIAVLIMAAVLRVMMIRPITRLADSMATVVPGGSARLVVDPRHATDEIGLLSRSANALLEASEGAVDALKHQNGVLSSLLKNLPVGVFMVEAPSGKPLMANEAALRLLGRGILPDASMPNSSEVYTLCRAGTREPYPHEEMPIVLGMRGITAHVDDMIVEHPDGTETLLEIFGSPVTDEQGNIRASLMSFIDITDRKKMEEQVRQLAFYDTLTRLPNRRLLSDRMAQAMAASKRNACHGALIFLDLDNFKPLNDMHGHDVGDLLLIEAADRLKSCVRQADTVARFGGDEFVLMITELDADESKSVEQAAVIAEKILATLSEPYLLNIRRPGEADTRLEHRCTASIGVALFLDHDAPQEHILKRADTAMYQAKVAGRNQIRFHDGQT